MDSKEVIQKIKSLENPKNIVGMARFGIRPVAKVYGVSMPEIRKLAKEIHKNVGNPTSHKLAIELFDSKIHEAKILAGLVADPLLLTEKEINKWVKDFDSWDVCDQVCMNLFDKSKFAYKKVFEFSKRKEEFVKRTAFALVASLAVHDKKAKDKDFIQFFSIIKEASVDERNFVKKAVNWALRGIGKRNLNLNKEAIKLAYKILKVNSKSAKWIANNAIRELESKEVQRRLKK